MAPIDTELEHLQENLLFESVGKVIAHFGSGEQLVEELPSNTLKTLGLQGRSHQSLDIDIQLALKLLLRSTTTGSAICHEQHDLMQLQSCNLKFASM